MYEPDAMGVRARHRGQARLTLVARSSVVRVAYSQTSCRMRSAPMDGSRVWACSRGGGRLIVLKLVCKPAAQRRHETALCCCKAALQGQAYCVQERSVAGLALPSARHAHLCVRRDGRPNRLKEEVGESMVHRQVGVDYGEL